VLSIPPRPQSKRNATGHIKMIRLLTIALTILTVVSCQNSRTENQLSSLEEYVLDTDSLTSNSEGFDQIVNIIQTNKPKYRQDETKFENGNVAGLSRELIFTNDYDTTGKVKDRVLLLLKVKEFTSGRKAAEAFLEMINAHACCIPQEDMIKLKNFENLDAFKNSASTTILSENIVIEYFPANQTFINEDNLKLVDQFLKERKHLKLEIGHGGPAVWTRK